jgi:hypothetical protein
MTRNTSIEPAALVVIGNGLRSLRDRIDRGRVIRGWRSSLAQPPANGWYPSGMAAPQAGSLSIIVRRSSPAPQAGGLLAISRWSRSPATTPPVSNVEKHRIPEGCQRGTLFAARVVDQHKKMGFTP